MTAELKRWLQAANRFRTMNKLGHKLNKSNRVLTDITMESMYVVEYLNTTPSLLTPLKTFFFFVCLFRNLFMMPQTLDAGKT